MSKIIRSGRLVLAAFGLLVMFAGSTQAQAANTAVLTFNDALTNLTGANRGLVSGHAGRTPAIAYAKVIVNNTSTGIRAVNCTLQYAGISSDIASVTLAPDAFATLTLQVVKGTTGLNVGAGLSCVVATAANTGVFARMSKITTLFVNSAVAGFGG